MPVPRQPLRPLLFSAEVTLYDVLPSTSDVFIGLHLAVTAPSAEDGCAGVVLFRGRDARPLHVVEAAHGSGVLDFFDQLSAWRMKYPHAYWCTHTTPMLKGLADYVQAHPRGVQELKTRLVSMDKLVRALPVVEAWSRGEVLLPSSEASEALLATTGRGPTWCPKLLEQLGAYGTAQPDGLVESLVSAHEIAEDVWKRRQTPPE